MFALLMDGDAPVISGKQALMLTKKWGRWRCTTESPERKLGHK
jgi:hypothetical protein